MKKSAIVIIAVLVIVIGIFFFQNQQKASESTNLQEPLSLNLPKGSSPSQQTVEITSNGFSPETITIKQGERITWLNKKTGAGWPASAVHPSHKSYPNSDIAKCGTDEENEIFDACRGLAQGESYSFTFNEVGSWSYHDHLNPSSRGTVVVQAS